MVIWRDCWDVAVRVTEERLSHVFEHPEMQGQEGRSAETLGEPELVIQSRTDPDVRLYYRSCETSALGGGMYICAVVKWRQDDAFLITAYFCNRPKRGTVLWPSQ